jgi:mRNA interferase RelE/StbE
MNGAIAVQYRIVFTTGALRDLRRLSPEVAKRITAKIDRLKDDLAGSVKRLTNHSPEYRLRVGDWGQRPRAARQPPVHGIRLKAYGDAEDQARVLDPERA